MDSLPAVENGPITAPINSAIENGRHEAHVHRPPVGRSITAIFGRVGSVPKTHVR